MSGDAILQPAVLCLIRLWCRFAEGCCKQF